MMKPRVRSSRVRLVIPVAIAMFVMGAAQTFAGEILVGEGEWQSLSGEGIRGTWVASLARDEGRLSGTLSLSGSNVFNECQVSGKIENSNIVLGTASDDQKQTVFSGILDGTSVKGEWQSALVKDEGIWYGTLSTE